MKPEKCLCCGSKKIQSFNALTLLEGDCYVHSYACADCGYVMFFANDLDKVERMYNEDAAEKKRVLGLQNKINLMNEEVKCAQASIVKMQAQIELLTKKADDDNITVKEQKKYLAEIADLNQSIKMLNEKINSLVSNINETQNEIQRRPGNDYKNCFIN